MCCGKCGRMTGMLLIVLGFIYLLVDLRIWTFWHIQWWTVVFLLAGVAWFAMSGCPECQSCCAPSQEKAAAKGKKK